MQPPLRPAYPQQRPRCRRRLRLTTSRRQPATRSCAPRRPQLPGADRSASAEASYDETEQPEAPLGAQRKGCSRRAWACQSLPRKRTKRERRRRQDEARLAGTARAASRADDGARSHRRIRTCSACAVRSAGSRGVDRAGAAACLALHGTGRRGRRRRAPAELCRQRRSQARLHVQRLVAPRRCGRRAASGSAGSSSDHGGGPFDRTRPDRRAPAGGGSHRRQAPGGGGTPTSARTGIARDRRTRPPSPGATALRATARRTGGSPNGPSRGRGERRARRGGRQLRYPACR